MNEELIFELECDQPENWESDSIFIRDGKGNIIEQIIPDDEEG